MSKRKNPWIEALKEWNKGKGTWCLPRKGTDEYEDVIDIMSRNKKRTIYSADEIIFGEELPEIIEEIYVEPTEEERIRQQRASYYKELEGFEASKNKKKFANLVYDWVIKKGAQEQWDKGNESLITFFITNKEKQLRKNVIQKFKDEDYKKLWILRERAEPDYDKWNVDSYKNINMTIPMLKQKEQVDRDYDRYILRQTIKKEQKEQQEKEKVKKRMMKAQRKKKEKSAISIEDSLMDFLMKA